MTKDEMLWNCGFMPEWLKRELRPLMKPMELPAWLGPPREGVPRPLVLAQAHGAATEEWRVFREGLYEVSSLGNVRRARPGIATFVALV